MYCQAAAKECYYLDTLEELRSNAVVEEAAGGANAQEEAVRIQKVAGFFTQRNMEDCKQDFCIVLNTVVRNAVVDMALRNDHYVNLIEEIEDRDVN